MIQRKWPERSRSFFIKFFLIGIFFCLPAQAIVGPQEVKSKEQLYEIFRSFLRITSPNRVPGTSGHTKAIEYLSAEVEAIKQNNKLTLSKQVFAPDTLQATQMYLNDYQTKVLPNFQPGHPQHTMWTRLTNSIVEVIKVFNRLKGQNLIVRIPAATKTAKTIVVMANYDTLGIDKANHSVLVTGALPGADANASGVVLALELIRFLAGKPLKYSFEFVFLDYGELGYMGARAYLRERKSEEFYAGINLMMLGHDTERFDLAKKYGNMKIYFRKSKDQEKELALTLAKADSPKRQLKWELGASGLDNGDHVIFWEKGIPAIVFSQNWESDYNLKAHHAPNDVLETLNFDTYHEIYTHLIRAFEKNWLVIK
jgi:hypothetical protein